LHTDNRTAKLSRAELTAAYETKQSNLYAKYNTHTYDYETIDIISELIMTLNTLQKLKRCLDTLTNNLGNLLFPLKWGRCRCVCLSVCLMP